MTGTRNLNDTMRKCIFGGIVCGTGAFVGGFIGGPIGIAVGSVAGAAFSARFFGFRSAPDVLQNDFTQNERTELLERLRRAIAESKESLIRLLMHVLEALFKCRSKKEFIEIVLMPILKEFAYVGLRSLIEYLSA